jgi:hypothetical protein
MMKLDICMHFCAHSAEKYFDFTCDNNMQGAG